MNHRAKCMYIFFFFMLNGPDNLIPTKIDYPFLEQHTHMCSSHWVPVIAEKLLMLSEVIPHHALMVEGWTTWLGYGQWGNKKAGKGTKAYKTVNKIGT